MNLYGVKKINDRLEVILKVSLVGPVIKSLRKTTFLIYFQKKCYLIFQVIASSSNFKLKICLKVKNVLYVFFYFFNFIVNMIFFKNSL